MGAAGAADPLPGGKAENVRCGQTLWKFSVVEFFRKSSVAESFQGIDTLPSGDGSVVESSHGTSLFVVPGPPSRGGFGARCLGSNFGALPVSRFTKKPYNQLPELIG